jgi:drug/metabolite transporter (DMT)-like permease
VKTQQAWIAFWMLGLIWGSSFMLIRLGVQELRPIEVVFARTAIAAVGMALVIAVRRVRVPTDWPTLRGLIILGIGNVVVPFTLITWGEQTVESGTAAVLQSTAALFALVVAHFTFADERMTRRKVIGLVTGFIGVMVLFSRGGDILAGNLAGQLAIVVASLFYGIFTSYSRRLIQGDVQPIVVAGSTLLTAAVVTAPFALLSETGFTPLDTLTPLTIGATAVLGLLNTFVAYLFFYYIVRELGASRAAMVTYVVPLVGVVLGAVFLHEEIGLSLLLGAALIIAGIGIANLRRLPWPRRAAPAEQVIGGD